MTIRIRVTQDHIDNGLPGSQSRCPIARALSEHFDAAGVTPSRIATVKNGPNGERSWQRIKTPWRAKRFIQRFDAGKRVRPFSFRLKTPDIRNTQE